MGSCTNPLKGDLNCDSEINISDIEQINAIIKEEKFSLLRGWYIEREDDSLTIEEIPTFDPF